MDQESTEMKVKQTGGKTSPKAFVKYTVIGALLLVYVAVTTIIFVVQKKKELLEQKRENTPQSKPSQVSTTMKEYFAAKEQQLQEKAAKDPNARKELAQHYQQMGDRNQSVEQYQKLLVENPNDTHVHLMLGQLYLGNQKTLPQALFHLQAVLQREPGHAKKQVIEMWISELRTKIQIEKRH